MELIKLYRNSLSKVMDHSVLRVRADRYGYRLSDIRKSYTFLLQLKALYQYSYVGNYKKQTQFIAKKLNISARTVKRRIEMLNNFGFSEIQGTTLRLLSYKVIRYLYSVKKKNRHQYTEIELNSLTELKIAASTLQHNINKQKHAIIQKSKKGATIIGGCEFDFFDHMGNKNMLNPNTFLSQKLVANLLGYKSGSTGFNYLQQLREIGLVEIKPNMKQLTKSQYNKLKEKPSTKNRLLIKGKKQDARFYLCCANIVKMS